jgi:hypothetical protein
MPSRTKFRKITDSGQLGIFTYPGLSGAGDHLGDVLYGARLELSSASSSTVSLLACPGAVPGLVRCSWASSLRSGDRERVCSRSIARGPGVRLSGGPAVDVVKGVPLLAAVTHRDALVGAQVEIGAKTNESRCSHPCSTNSPRSVST